MKNIEKRAYECPVSEQLNFLPESALLTLSVNGGEQPVDPSQPGGTEGWGWS